MSLAHEIKMNPFRSERHEALLNIVRTADIIGKVSSSFFNQFNLTEAQYNVLIVLKLTGKSMTQVSISQRLIASRANITGLLDQLEKKKLVERKRDENDRRIFNVHLTNSGQRLLTKVEPLYIDKVEEVMACISNDACKDLSRSLVTVRANLYNVKGDK